jgi:hypothetical protein
LFGRHYGFEQGSKITAPSLYEIEALIEVLARRGIVNEAGVLEEIKKMRGKSNEQKK